MQFTPNTRRPRIVVSFTARNNRGTGFLSPDHCRTPILSKPEESLYADIQVVSLVLSER